MQKTFVLVVKQFRISFHFILFSELDFAHFLENIFLILKQHELHISNSTNICPKYNILKYVIQSTHQGDEYMTISALKNFA